MADDLIPYHQGMDYGVGLDSPSGDTRNFGVLGTPSSIPNAGGSIVDYELSQISTDEDLQTSLGVSVSASGGIGPFSASASLDFARKCHVHSSSVFLLASVKVNLAFAQIKEPKIQPEAAAKLADGNSTRFQEMYGDSFVRGIQTGGRFFAVIEIFASSRSEQESLSASVKGSYGLFSAKGSFSSEFTEAVSSRSLQIRVHHEGGVIPKDPTSLEEVQALATTFAASVEGHAVPYGVLLDKYTILDLPNPPNYIDLQNQMEVLASCAGQRNAIWTALNNVDYVLANPGQFTDKPGDDDMAPLVAYRAALVSDLKAVTAAATRALDHPKSAELPTLTATPPEMPKRIEHSSQVVQIFTHADYADEWQGIPGRSQQLSIGRYDDAESQILIGNDQISSLKVPAGLGVRCYDHAWFQGPFIDFTADTPKVPMEWNDRISSIIVYSLADGPPKIDYVVALDFPWVRPLHLKVGRYPDLGTTTLGSATLGTLLIPRGLSVKLWDAPNFQGESVEVFGDTTDLGVWDNRAVSLEVLAA